MAAANTKVNIEELIYSRFSTLIKKETKKVIEWLTKTSILQFARLRNFV